MITSGLRRPAHRGDLGAPWPPTCLSCPWPEYANNDRFTPPPPRPEEPNLGADTLHTRAWLGREAACRNTKLEVGPEFDQDGVLCSVLFLEAPGSPGSFWRSPFATPRRPRTWPEQQPERDRPPPHYYYNRTLKLQAAAADHDDAGTPAPAPNQSPLQGTSFSRASPPAHVERGGAATRGASRGGFRGVCRTPIANDVRAPLLNKQGSMINIIACRTAGLRPAGQRAHVSSTPHPSYQRLRVPGT